MYKKVDGLQTENAELAQNMRKIKEEYERQVNENEDLKEEMKGLYKRIEDLEGEW